MKMTAQKRSLFILCLLLIVLLISACTKSPEEVRAWLKDKRAPVKMKEFIQNKRFPIESKIEAVMVLTERGDCSSIPDALSGNIKTDELNRIVAGVITRMQALIDSNPDSLFTNSTRVKDAAYYLLKLELNDNNREDLMAFIRDWLDGDNFFLETAKAGRVEQNRLFELLGDESLEIYKKAITTKMDELEAALAKEAAQEAELQEKGEKFKITYRPSDGITNTLATILTNLDALKLPGSSEMVATLFIDRINAQYPDMPRAYVLPFRNNTSEKLIDVASRIVNDTNYKSNTLNYYKDVMFVTYYRNVQKKAGVDVCTPLIQSDRTGYTRWDCLEILTTAKGRDGFVQLIQSIPDDPTILLTPTDHPTLLAQPNMTFWNSMRAYCAHLPGLLNNQVPLDVFRQLVTKGRAIDRILSMACLATLGNESDVETLAAMRPEKTDIKNYGVQVPTMGDLSYYSSVLLSNRLENAKKAEAAEAEKKAKEAEKEAAEKQAAEKQAADPAAAQPAEQDAAKAQ